MKYSILLAGVGGQGLMLLSQVIGDACTKEGINVRVGAQHGLAQRSGSISAHVRVGEVYSPLIPYGGADMIVAMEAMEALRYVEYLRDGGAVVMSSRLIHPPLETAPIVKNRQEKRAYFTLGQVLERLGEVTKEIKALDSSRLAEQSGNPRTENVVLLGAASKSPSFPVPRGALLEAVKRNVPASALEANLKAFELGESA